MSVNSWRYLIDTHHGNDVNPAWNTSWHARRCFKEAGHEIGRLFHLVAKRDTVEERVQFFRARQIGMLVFLDLLVIRSGWHVMYQSLVFPCLPMTRGHGSSATLTNEVM